MSLWMRERMDKDIACQLSEIVNIDLDRAEHVLADEQNRCISILHVREDGWIDVQAVEDYRPVTPCMRCRTGDVLLSKINPRILRIAVVPAMPWRLGCSPEFAVLRCKPMVTSWELVLLLRSLFVQAQLCSLTSGVSPSHNRIRTKELGTTLIPIPVKNRELLTWLANQSQSVMEQYYKSTASISAIYKSAQYMLEGKCRNHQVYVQ